MHSDPPSVTTWIGLLKAGEEDAAARLWGRFFPRMVDLAGKHLKGSPRAVSDEEDIASAAFAVFCNAATAGRMENVQDRDSLWRMLMVITAGKAVDQYRREAAAKRGGGRAASPEYALTQLMGRDPDPAFAAAVAEQFQALLAMLPAPLRELAVLKFEGYSNDEIADKSERSPRTVTRQLTLIRKTWQATADTAEAAIDG